MNCEQVRILRLPKVIEKVGLSKPTIYRMMSDGTFPKNMKIGQRATGWFEHEIDAWAKKVAKSKS